MKVAVLFSGDAASVYSLHLAREVGLEVRYLVTARDPQSPRIYRSLDLDLTRLSARSLAIPLIEFVADSEGDISSLIQALRDLDIDGLCDGAVRSNRRRNRLLDVCQKLEIQLILPLWHKDPSEILANMVEEGFEIMIVKLKSDRLDESWHGQVLDGENRDEFLQACDESEIDPMGESGEFETIILAGPNMQSRIGVSVSAFSNQSPLDEVQPSERQAEEVEDDDRDRPRRPQDGTDQKHRQAVGDGKAADDVGEIEDDQAEEGVHGQKLDRSHYQAERDVDRHQQQQSQNYDLHLNHE